MRSVIVMCSHYRFAAHGASETRSTAVDKAAKSFQRSGPMSRTMSHTMSRTIHFAVLMSLLLALAPALADDRVSPRGAPWWRELAQCGGLALALRDRAVDQKQPPERIAGLTRAMQAYLDAGAVQLRHDRGIEPSPAKRSVYQSAGKAWEAFKGSPAPLSELVGKLTACAAQLEDYRKLQ
jgi:hypothetical protein